MKSLLKFAENKYSQNGEDGILAEIFERLGIEKGWFVEFGAWDGKFLSNTFALLRNGWSGVGIEGDPKRFQDLVETADQYKPHLHAVEAFVESKGKNSLDNLLKPFQLSKEFEILSIDIDSYDSWVWEGMTDYKPKIVIIEINSSFSPGINHRQPDKAHLGDHESGTSFTTTLAIGAAKGYQLVCHTGNMIFVRNDLVSKLRLPKEEIENPDQLFVDTWVPSNAGPNSEHVTRIVDRLKAAAKRLVR